MGKASRLDGLIDGLRVVDQKFRLSLNSEQLF